MKRQQISTIAPRFALFMMAISWSIQLNAVEPANPSRRVTFVQAAMIELPPADRGGTIKAADALATGDEEKEPAPRDPIAERLSSMMRPLGAIELKSGSDVTKAPEDKAAAHRSTEVTEIYADFRPTLLSNRYPINAIHNPLYFEEPNLERCGNACGIATTAVSALHFVANTLTLPYQIAADPPWTTACTTQDCRCCEELPQMRPFECKLRAATLQGLATAGFVFLLL